MRGVLTTIRLENLFWEVLTEMAARESITTNQLVAKLHDEVVAWRGESDNFASFLWVCCLRYLAGVAEGPLKQAARVATVAGLRSVGWLRLEIPAKSICGSGTCVNSYIRLGCAQHAIGRHARRADPCTFRSAI